ncbi:LysE family translocator [Aeromicrobium chenweiae]|uniref:Lysine transporter LysE n=1 Tax=Aeromicrobium chenweiae TaxID=2079793 RepID=A0A2S0WQC3_9ACTN|nr:LysE family transporter [Aeromicrobium chenweiae]AWB93563.1 lysine transporter LysE [Aeromicrobium chenweiae]
MITLDQLLAFGLAALVLIAIPGPSVVFVIGRALAYGRGVALATVAGNTLGLLVVVVLVALGLGAVVQESIIVFTALKLAGAAYLVWLGVQAVRHRSAFVVREADEQAPPVLAWAVVASQLRSWFSASPRRGAALGVVGGTSMIGLGVGLAVTGDHG